MVVQIIFQEISAMPIMILIRILEKSEQFQLS